MGLALEIIEIKDDHSKGSDLRRAGALKIIGSLISYHHIPDARRLFLDSIQSKNNEEQFAALEGLGNYYEFSDDEPEDDLLNILDDIMADTDDRAVVSTCLQIQINAGLMDEMTALTLIDDWEDAHFNE